MGYCHYHCYLIKLKYDRIARETQSYSWRTSHSGIKYKTIKPFRTRSVHWLIIRPVLRTFGWILWLYTLNLRARKQLPLYPWAERTKANSLPEDTVWGLFLADSNTMFLSGCLIFLDMAQNLSTVKTKRKQQFLHRKLFWNLQLWENCRGNQGLKRNWRELDLKKKNTLWK